MSVYDQQAINVMRTAMTEGLCLLIAVVCRAADMDLGNAQRTVAIENLHTATDFLPGRASTSGNALERRMIETKTSYQIALHRQESFRVKKSSATSFESAVGNPYLFQGRRFDPETGLYYFRNRYYDPRSGRFLQRDPAWDAGNVGGQYTFVGNTPATRRDPHGLWGENLVRMAQAGHISLKHFTSQLDTALEKKWITTSQYRSLQALGEIDSIAKKFKGTGDIAGVAEHLYDFNERFKKAFSIDWFTWNNENSRLTPNADDVTRFLHTREMSCYEFVHFAAWIASDQPTRPNNRGGAVHWGFHEKHINDIDAVTSPSPLEIPRNQIVTYSSPFIDNNQGGYYHVMISIGAGETIGLGADGFQREMRSWPTQQGTYFNSRGGRGPKGHLTGNIAPGQQTLPPASPIRTGPQPSSLPTPR